MREDPLRRLALRMLVTGFALMGCDEQPIGLPRPGFVPPDPSSCHGSACDEPPPSAPPPSAPPPSSDPNVCEAATCSCLIDAEGGFCQTPHCIVTVEPGALGRPATFGIEELSLDGAAGDEILARRACRATTDAAPVELARKFEVAMLYDQTDVPAGFSESEIVAVSLDTEPTIAWHGVLDVSRNRVALGTDHGLTLGTTVLPSEIDVGPELGIDPFLVYDAATLDRNLSRYRFSSTFHDGQRFYVANGPRVLIWNGGIPTSRATLPDIILGRPDLSSPNERASASAFEGPARGVWSDGQRLVVTEQNRALIWTQVPTTSFAPADVVLGQPDFSSTDPNRGGLPSAGSLDQPDDVWSDGTRLVIADTQNHRHLVWNSFPTANGQEADLVIGQQDFDLALPRDSSTPTQEAHGIFWNGSTLALSSRYGCNCIWLFDGFPQLANPAPDEMVGASKVLNRVLQDELFHPDAMAGFGSDGLILRDGWRASIFRTFPHEGSLVDFVLGKPDATLGGVVGRVSAASFADATPNSHVTTRSQQVVVVDGRRLLVWRTLPDASFVPADLVLGQPSASTNDEAIDYRGIDRDTVAAPAGMSVVGNVTVVADRGNDRVLVIRGGLSSPESVVVVGQPSAAAFGPNGGGFATASSLSSPTDAFTDGTRLVVADAGNHRILVWNTLPTEDGAPADRVLGQPDFSSSSPNRGASDADGDGDLDATAISLHFPSGVFADDTGLYVADTFNHRVLVFDPLDAVPSDQPSTVIGQPGFGTNDPNRGLGWFARSAESLARPTDVARLAGGQLAVVDGQNNRVLVYDLGDPTAATSVLGQPDFVSDVSPQHLSGTNSGFPVVEATKHAYADTLHLPFGLGVSGSSLYVSDTGNHRVVRYDDPLTTGAPAAAVWGQVDLEHRLPNEGGVSASTFSRPEGIAVASDGQLLVSDTDNHRLLAFAGAAPATAVFGQRDPFHNGPNRTAPAYETLEGPRAVAWDGTRLWVADAGNHRVVVYDGASPTVALGQPDLSLDLPNAGASSPDATTFATPSAIWTDGTRLAVADTDNHRVLLWNDLPDATHRDADVVLGQVDFSSGAENSGAGATVTSASALQSPQGVWVDGTSVYVSDTGNHRVLRWDTWPTSSGVAADAVLCQPSFTDRLSNRGTSTPSATTCAGPTGVLVVDGTLWVADSGNHRVLAFDAAFASQDTAQLVVGQPDFTTRLPVNGDLDIDAATMGSPTGLAWDGHDLYVSELDNHRILVFEGAPTVSGAPADRVLGQIAFDERVVSPEPRGLDGPRGLAVVTEAYHSATLWIADSGKDRVVAFDRVPRPF